MTFDEWYKDSGFEYDPEAHEWIAKAAWWAATAEERNATRTRRMDSERKINELKNALEWIRDSGDHLTANSLRSIAENALYNLFGA